MPSAGTDEFDPGVIHQRWVKLYKRWGMPKELVVPRPNFSRQFIVSRKNLEEPRVPIYVHPKLALPMFNDLFPAMWGHWSLTPGSGTANNYGLSGWLFVEAALEATFRKTDQYQLEEIAKINGWKGQTEADYLIFGEYCKATYGCYPDLETWVRLLGSSCNGRVIFASFYSSGHPRVDYGLPPSHVHPYLGGRFAEMPSGG